MTKLIFLLQKTPENTTFTNVMSIILITGGLLIICLGLFRFVEGFYIDYISRKPLFRHFYLFNKDLNSTQKTILENEFAFYQRLDVKEQKYFRHRVFKFISQVEFIGREGLEIDDEKKILVAATAIMLTFGYRDYNINLVDKILIYPSTFYSNLDKNYHKGHFNPGYRAIILSWEDFLDGYNVTDDNLNLGIHEFVHALHLSYLNDNDGTSAHIFITTLNELNEYLESNLGYKKKMKNSDYFRSYAFENDFEFIAVVIENFMETPSKFISHFPELYKHIKQMLNFNFTGY